MLFQLIEKKIRSNMKFFIYLQKEKCKKKKKQRNKNISFSSAITYLPQAYVFKLATSAHVRENAFAHTRSYMYSLMNVRALLVAYMGEFRECRIDDKFVSWIKCDWLADSDVKRPVGSRQVARLRRVRRRCVKIRFLFSPSLFFSNNSIIGTSRLLPQRRRIYQRLWVIYGWSIRRVMFYLFFFFFYAT